MGIVTPVTLVTKDATLDNLSLQDYRDIWQELRQNHSLRDVIAAMQSQLSPARWSQYEKREDGKDTPSRQMRNDLRRAVGLPLLPPTVADAVAQASPDAAVWYIGVEGAPPPDTVIMVAAEHEIWVHVNGTVEATQAAPFAANVTPVTKGKVERKHYLRPCVPFEYSERLQRLGDGFSWVDVIEAGLRTLEAMP